MIGPKPAVVLAVAGVAAVSSCAGSSEGAAPMTMATPRATPEPTARPTTTDPNATTTPLATLGSQYWPGEMWPPPEVLGVQYWPGTEHWPPPPACFPKSGICIEQAASGRASSLSVPSTTVAPAATSTTALTGVQRAVLDQVGVTEAAYDAALRNPDDESLVAAIEAATVDGSPAREEFVRAYQSHIAQGRWAVADAEVANSVAVVGSPAIVGDGSVAVVTVCHVSGDTLMGVGAGGHDEVLADSRNARLILQTFHLVNDAWKLFLREQLAIIPEGTSCEASIDPPPSVH